MGDQIICGQRTAVATRAESETDAILMLRFEKFVSIPRTRRGLPIHLALLRSRRSGFSDKVLR